MRVLRELQGFLEALYRVEADADVRDFIIDGETRRRMGVRRAPREQLLLRQPGDGELEVALFVDDEAVRRIERAALDAENLQDWLLVAEGVSHFLYVVLRARHGRPFSVLELELQAEVDKYLLVLLATWDRDGDPPGDLRARLFERVSFHADLSRDERDRYRAANAAADDYVASLESRFVRRRAVADLLEEVRRFYRLSCTAKLDHITRKAA